VRRLAACLAVLALLLFVAPATASTTVSSQEHRILDQINAERAARGLRPLRADIRVWDLAGDRAARMASTGVMSHTIAGSLGTSLTARGVRRWSYGEDIGYSTAARGIASTNELFSLWRASPDHWALMMSSRYNYVGIGLAFRSSTGQTYGSIVFIEGLDRSGPVATMLSVTRTGHDIRWTWTATDALLQTHMSGVAGYQIQTRTDLGAWHTVASLSRATSRTVHGNASRHTYGVRVRPIDRAGNRGSWSRELRIWVP